VAAISPFVDELMRLIRKCGCADEGESDVEIALREALANAIIHGNHENPGKHVHVRCRCEPNEISIAVKDEERGVDVDTIADPTAPENHGSIHGRGIYLMKALMDEVSFEDAAPPRDHERLARELSRPDSMEQSGFALCVPTTSGWLAQPDVEFDCSTLEARWQCRRGEKPV
jgi:serine/threonine-protein kinase RsbW